MPCFVRGYDIGVPTYAIDLALPGVAASSITSSALRSWQPGGLFGDFTRTSDRLRVTVPQPGYRGYPDGWIIDLRITQDAAGARLSGTLRNNVAGRFLLGIYVAVLVMLTVITAFVVAAAVRSDVSVGTLVVWSLVEVGFAALTVAMFVRDRSMAKRLTAQLRAHLISALTPAPAVVKRPLWGSRWLRPRRGMQT